MVYEFTLVLADVPKLTDEISERIFAAGCDDATPHSSGGVTEVDFDRDSDSLENAIRSAVAQVSAAGYRTARVEIAGEALSVRS